MKRDTAADRVAAIDRVKSSAIARCPDGWGSAMHPTHVVLSKATQSQIQFLG